ncbi:MAG TPA: DUF5996 family protein [Terriglobales bacterium]|jgi:hypothetical protein|nr:DUF5996 family protein [Terriglobales bacterium]
MNQPAFADNPESWPALPLEAWKDTRDTLHMWTQIVGKVRMALTPKVNHWWEVPLYVSARGLTTSPIPYARGIFEVEFDFLTHNLWIQTSEAGRGSIQLKPRSVADFYKECMSALRSLGIEVKIWHMPVEVPDPIPFDQDVKHASYDREYATRFWRVLVLVDTIFKEFRGHFIGKNSPVHFFWGSFDMAVTRFSGRRALPREGADAVTREAYSHEVISAGFWPGGGEIKDAAFYAYAAPEPEGYGKIPVRPTNAFYHLQMREFFLMYDEVRQAASPRSTLLDFLQSTYEGAADLARWNRTELETPA